MRSMDINTEFKMGHSEVMTLKIVLQNLNLIRIVNEKTKLAYERKEDYGGYAFEIAPELINVYLQCNDQKLYDFEEIICGYIIEMEYKLEEYKHMYVITGLKEDIREKYQIAPFIRLIFVVLFGFESQSQNAFRALIRLSKTFSRIWHFTPLYYNIIGECLVKALLEYSGRVVFSSEREQVFLRFFSILANIMIANGSDPILGVNNQEIPRIDRSSVDTFYVASLDEDFDNDTKTLIELPEIKCNILNDSINIIEDSDDESFGYLNCFDMNNQDKLPKKKTGFSLHNKARQKWKQNFAKV